ncbi:MAG: hypothetical protein ACPIOQ_00045 [Promethearchaeia archaeon]
MYQPRWRSASASGCSWRSGRRAAATGSTAAGVRDVVVSTLDLVVGIGAGQRGSGGVGLGRHW